MCCMVPSDYQHFHKVISSCINMSLQPDVYVNVNPQRGEPLDSLLFCHLFSLNTLNVVSSPDSDNSQVVIVGNQ